MTLYVNVPLSKKSYQRIKKWAETHQQDMVEFIAERLESDRHIEITPGVRGGKPRLTATRITVSDIVVMHLKMGRSVPEIAAEYDLSLTSVYAVLAYYYDNQEKIDCQLAEDEAFAVAFQRQNPSQLQTRLKQLRGD